MRVLFFCLAFLSLGLGTVGIFVPVLPTTPLVMLSAFLFGKSSQRFHNWITGTRIYEKYAKDFVENRTMTLGRKIFIVSLASVMLLFPLIMLAPIWKIVIVGVYLFLYYYFIFQIKTAPREKKTEE